MLADVSKEISCHSQRGDALRLGEGRPLEQMFPIGAAARASSWPVPPGQGDAEVARGVGAHPNTVINVCKRFAVAGIHSVERPEQKRREAYVLYGQAVARLIVLVGAGSPAGRKTWTMPRLAGRLMEARVVDSVTGETVHQTLKK